MKQRKNKKNSEKSVGNVKILVSGLVLLVAAFFVLSMANPYGNNFAGHAAPFVFIFSCAVILTGILWNGQKDGGMSAAKDKEK